MRREGTFIFLLFFVKKVNKEVNNNVFWWRTKRRDGNEVKFISNYFIVIILI